ncbi:MAG TPA: hypothetical protein VI864_08835 [Candidatus Bathyarchaeia archaeon]|nr:hypothetical protein [Candidatus Bathyarchaeia archaeon]
MLGKKKIAVLATVLMATLVVGVYAGTLLSNTLTANWVVRESGTSLQLYWYSGTPSGDLNKGTWYDTYLGLRNLGQATYNNVIVKFKIYADVSLLTNCITLKGYTNTWIVVSLTLVTEGGKDIFTGSWGPAEGFAVGPGYDVVTHFQYMFEGNAPVDQNYYFSAWVETVP